MVRLRRFLLRLVTAFRPARAERDLAREVAAFDGKQLRQLIVKPGVTGLWQVSGRSDLSEANSMRLDLSYVENFSMAQDLRLIARTVRAVTQGEGKY